MEKLVRYKTNKIQDKIVICW